MQLNESIAEHEIMYPVFMSFANSELDIHGFKRFITIN